MSDRSQTNMGMPELLVFARAMLLGAVLFEIFWVAYLGAEELGRDLPEWGIVGWLVLLGYAATLPIVYVYAKRRGCFPHAARILQSRRIDLLLLVGFGALVMYLFDPVLAKFHEAVSHADMLWAPTVFAVLIFTLISPIWLERSQRKQPDTTQPRLLADDEIKEGAQDVLDVDTRARDFADTVLVSGAQPGLVFGIDGPWGVGKTSFLNLTKNHWEKVASDRVIVFTFEPLRYASEPDLSERFIKDLCAAIRQKVFAPELLPLASRYSRMLKGKTDFSVLGIKFSFEPSSETVDELLEDIDKLLKQLGRRLIVIVDDLDRLESKLVNNVLFTVRRTFKLSQATYVLCYDTENLLASMASKDEGARAREFLEKFITAKLSLFVDLKPICNFLDTNRGTVATKSDTMSLPAILELGEIMQAVQTLLKGPKAHCYVPLLGDLRKIKRFVNAALLMNMEKVKLSSTDFNIKDLIHLILLNQNYPRLFRQIYSAETEGRKGTFGVLNVYESQRLKPENGHGLEDAINQSDEPAKFLLRQLFDVETLEFPYSLASNKDVLRSRACFNWEHRNLERYLNLIVRQIVPEPTQYHRFYTDLVESVMAERENVAEILQRQAFAQSQSEMPQEFFWELLVSRAAELKQSAANNIINTLVDWLPKYSSLALGNYSMRERAVLSLARLIDRAGFGDLPENGLRRGEAALPELAIRLIGRNESQSPPSLIRQLVAPERGALGWGDLMELRMQCSMDTLGNVSNIYMALARHESPDARIVGDIYPIAVNSMRKFSQSVFAEFKRIYIDGQLNFFLEVDSLSEEQILGEGGRAIVGDVSNLENKVHSSRTELKSFVIYHLTNTSHGSAQGVGCGRYDESGSQDASGIRQAMIKYLLEFCFNPSHGVRHAQAFADFCFRPTPFSYNQGGTLDAVTSLLGNEAITEFWSLSGDQIKQQLRDATSDIYEYRRNKMTYEEWRKTLFDALDQLVKSFGVSEQSSVPEGSVS